MTNAEGNTFKEIKDAFWFTVVDVSWLIHFVLCGDSISLLRTHGSMYISSKTLKNEKEGEMSWYYINLSMAYVQLITHPLE